MLLSHEHHQLKLIQVALDQSIHEGLFIGKKLVQRANRHPSTGRDGVGGGGCVTDLSKELGGHVEQVIDALLASRMTGRQPAISVNALKAMNRRHEVSAAKVIRELGMTFRPMEETIRDTANWFLANGYAHSAGQMQAASA